MRTNFLEYEKIEDLKKLMNEDEGFVYKCLDKKNYDDNNGIGRMVFRRFERIEAIKKELKRRGV